MSYYFANGNSRRKTLTTNNNRALISLNVEVKALNQEVKELKLVIQEKFSKLFSNYFLL